MREGRGGRVLRRRLGRHRAAAALALLVAIATAPACSDSGDDGEGAAAGSGVRVERVELDPALSGMVAFDDVLLAAGGSDDLTDRGVLQSSDAGRTWRPVRLPGAPARLALDMESPTAPGDVAVVAGRGVVDDGVGDLPGGGFYVWVTGDGVTWQGGELAPSGPPFGRIGVAAVGDTLLAGFTAGPPEPGAAGTFALHRSTDGGASWQPARVPALPTGRDQLLGLRDAWQLPDGRLAATVVPHTPPGVGLPPLLTSSDGGATWAVAECPPGSATASELTGETLCQAPEQAGDLLYRRYGEEVSVDGGRSWQAASFAPRPAGTAVAIEGAVAERGGGWLAAAASIEPSDASHAYLLRSVDGIRWEPVARECSSDDVLRPIVGVSVPLRLRDGPWLVARSCFPPGPGSDKRSELLLVPDGGEPELLPGSRRDGADYGTPVTVGDTVVVPEGSGGRHRALLLVTS